MDQALGRRQVYLTNVQALDANLSALNTARFIPVGTGRVIGVFITVTGFTAITLRPVFREPVRAGYQDLARDQFPNSNGDIVLTAAGTYYREIRVPRGMEMALGVLSLTGVGAVSVFGYAQDAL